MSGLTLDGLTETVRKLREIRDRAGDNPLIGAQRLWMNEATLLRFGDRAIVRQRDDNGRITEAVIADIPVGVRESAPDGFILVEYAPKWPRALLDGEKFDSGCRMLRLDDMTEGQK